MATAAPQRSWWQWILAARYVRMIVLLAAVLAMTIAANMVVMAVQRVARWLTTGAAFAAPIVPGQSNVTIGIAVSLALLVSFGLVLWGYAAISARLERRRVAELERAGMAARLGQGALIGIGLITGAVGIMALLASVSLRWGPPFALTSATVVPVIVAPILEELLFRGIIFRLVEEIYGTVVALAASALLFGFAHIANPNASVLAASFIAIEAGVLLGMAYVATRSLWLPIGLHFGWNFTEGDVFGLADSGNSVPGIFATSVHGDPLITGGAFGPEASVITPVLAIAAAAIFYRVAQQRGSWQPLRMQHVAPVG